LSDFESFRGGFVGATGSSARATRARRSSARVLSSARRASDGSAEARAKVRRWAMGVASFLGVGAATRARTAVNEWFD